MATKIGPVPEHLAIIPDGNRRWSRSHSLALLKGYDMGIKKFISVSEWCKKLGVKTVSVWALSTENVKSRTSAELNVLYSLYVRACDDPEIIKTLDRNKSRVNVIGDKRLLPKKVRQAFDRLEARTRHYKEFTINLLVGYGGKDDLLHAAKRLYLDAIHKRIKSINDRIIRSYLRTSVLPDVDLIIRTSGEFRTSGLLPWQSDYSELYFSKKYWPDFGKNDLEAALRTFSKRQRRFGK
ncbi:MAG: di-trans,poly-cis-decaprenylcistransferase [Candidatus Micrarchaeota archaeon]|nr:di-trans,poly-cis-decaprenylcistransferase [Candidatus Micrarchaeota archaeon]